MAFNRTFWQNNVAAAAAGSFQSGTAFTQSNLEQKAEVTEAL